MSFWGKTLMAVVNCPRGCLEQWIAKQLKCFENIYLRKPLFCITRFFFHASAKSTSCTKDTREKHVRGVGGGQGTPYLPHLHKGMWCCTGYGFGVLWFSGYAIVHVLYYFALWECDLLNLVTYSLQVVSSVVSIFFIYSIMSAKKSSFLLGTNRTE